MRLDFRNLHHAPPPQFSHLMGLGDVCVSGPYGSDANGPLCLDQTTGSPVSCSDPRCAAGGGSSAAPASNTPGYIPENNPTFSTQQFGNSTTTTFTLDSYLSQWASGITGQSLDSLANQGMNSVSAIISQLAAVAQQYCQVEAPSDCGNISAIVAKYAAMITSAYSNVAASQWNPATFTAYATPTPSALSVPSIPTPQVPISAVTPPAGGIVVSPTPAAITSGAAAAPSAASSGSTSQTGSTNTSSTSASSTSFLTEDSISGIPNWALLAAAAVALFIFAGGKR